MWSRNRVIREVGVSAIIGIPVGFAIAIGSEQSVPAAILLICGIAGTTQYPKDDLS